MRLDNQPTLEEDPFVFYLNSLIADVSNNSQFRRIVDDELNRLEKEARSNPETSLLVEEAREKIRAKLDSRKSTNI